MVKRGFNEEDKMCECGEQQTDEHLLSCIMSPAQFTKEDLILTDTNDLEMATYVTEYVVFIRCAELIYGFILLFKYILVFFFLFWI